MSGIRSPRRHLPFLRSLALTIDCREVIGFWREMTYDAFDCEAAICEIFRKIGDPYVTLWSRMIWEYSDMFVFFRMGDDLGYKTPTMLAPQTIRQFIRPQYRRVIGLVHQAGKKFLRHSCRCIFGVMEDLIGLCIDAKHSDEDQSAPFDRWIHL